MENQIYTKCADPQFEHPYIDVDEWRNEPVRHRYVHGGFEGTETKFCFYFPEKEQFQNRFYQLLMPMQGPETAAQGQVGEEDIISFSILHGAYFVQTNLGGILNGGGDETLVYRCSAQAAEYSRKLAQEMYGCGRPFGYCFGGSGGGFKTISCAENTEGYWDGAVPFVIGSSMAMPNVFTVRAHAMRILRHKMNEIVDAIEPGGSGDPYSVLNEEEAAALREAEAMGFPMETWCVWETLGEGALPVLYPAVPAIDPAYFTDFWEKEGYLGTEPGSSAVRDRIQLETSVSKIFHPETGIQGLAESIDEGNSYGVDEAWKHQFGKAGKLPVLELASFPEGDVYTRGLEMTFLDGALAGQTIKAMWLGYSLVTGEPDISGRDLAEMLGKARAGDRVKLDNSDYLAVQTYHRHQVPGPEFHAWDIFRNEDGTPKYPQRPVLVAPILAKGGAGGIQNGTPRCKLIVLESHMDESAFPWQADWYRHKVMENSGTDGNETIRLYYMEHCMHTDCQEGNGGDHEHIVSYLGALHQALLDLSDWVERGIEPAATSGYSMDGGQVLLPDTAEERKGIQPLVRLSARKADDADKMAEVRITVRAGEPVLFHAEVELPAGSGDLEEVTWGMEDQGVFIPMGEMSGTKWLADGTGCASAEVQHIFERPGTYFPVVKVASNRTPGDFFTRIRNQARMRVIVTG